MTGTVTSLATVVLDGERHEVALGSLYRVRTNPRDCQDRNSEVKAAGGWYVGFTKGGEPFVTTADRITIAMPPRALPRRVEPSRNPLRLTTPERGLWWCITVGSLLWAGAVTFAVEVLR